MITVNLASPGYLIWFTSSAKAVLTLNFAYGLRLASRALILIFFIVCVLACRAMFLLVLMQQFEADHGGPGLCQGHPDQLQESEFKCTQAMEYTQNYFSLV